MKSLPHGRRYAIFDGAVSTTEFVAVHFKNPSGSGVDAYIYRIVSDSVGNTGAEKAFTVVAGPQNTDIGGETYTSAAKSFNSYQDGDADIASQCQITSTLSAVGDNLPDVNMMKWAHAPNSNLVFNLENEPITVKPGEGWMFKGQANDNEDLDIVIFWVERPN